MMATPLCTPNSRSAVSSDWGAMLKLARRFTNENAHYNRVIVPLTEVDPATLTVHAKVHDLESADLLRDVDDYFIRSRGGASYSQALVVLLPLSSDEHRYSVAVRMIETNDFMTANAVLPSRDFPNWKAVAEGILSSFERVEAVFYDVTGKPPATVEWL